MSEHPGALDELRAKLLSDYQDYLRECPEGKMPLVTWLVEEIRTRDAEIELQTARSLTSWLMDKALKVGWLPPDEASGMKARIEALERERDILHERLGLAPMLDIAFLDYQNWHEKNKSTLAALRGEEKS